MPKNYTLVKNIIFREEDKLKNCTLIKNKLTECMLTSSNNVVACYDLKQTLNDCLEYNKKIKENKQSADS